MDVSVIDPRGDDWASVPHLPRDAFEIRIDGEPLSPQIAARTEFDEICPDAERTGPALLADPRPTLVVLADLNFLDARARHAVARALDDLADIAAARPIRVKVLAFGHRVTALTPSFTSDPEVIRSAADDLRRTVGSGPPLIPRDPPTATFSPPRPELSAPVDVVEPAPPDPERLRPPFAVAAPQLGAVTASGPRGPREPISPDRELAERSDFDPRPSLAAIESVLLSHAGEPGRKALVLFTSDWFDLPDRLWLSEMSETLLAAQNGFTVWTVDARGLAAAGHRPSGLLGQLAAASGGGTVRSAGRLAVAFERALSQLSCYYLFSIPAEPPERGSERHSVTVALDTRRHPEYWAYRVKNPNGFTLLSPARHRERLRLAALMEPDAHRFPEVRVSASYPDGKKWVMPVEFSVLLSDLSFEPTGKGFEARFGWEGIVTDEEGRTRCRLGDGRVRRVRVASPPARHPPTMLVVRTACPLGGPGLLDVRVVVEDIVSGEIGAGTSFVDVPEPGGGLARFSPLRLGVASGRDFLVALPLPAADVPRDEARAAFVPLRPGEAVLTTDRLAARFVACGQEPPPRVVLYRRSSGAATPKVEALYQLLTAARGAVSRGGTVCREYEAVVPEKTLGPGRYGLAILDRRRRIPSRAALESLLAAGEAEARAEFRVAPAPQFLPPGDHAGRRPEADAPLLTRRPAGAVRESRTAGEAEPAPAA
ncbi:MAG: hypothetical protein D6718_01385 [Acidobacteria bacterium]|nr:MAG: hypothetical protein D6718_01385 [Acidobacteriota bacterium]